MKKILTFAAIALIGSVALTSCSKSSSSSPAYSMKATIGGTAAASTFNESNCLAVASGGGLVITAYAGSASSATTPQINIAIVTWSGSTGTTTFDSTLSTGYEEYLPNTTTITESKTGTVTLTSVSTSSISGTFSFTGDDGTVVSNGSFTAKR